jgi:hypothetical protein
MAGKRTQAHENLFRTTDPLLIIALIAASPVAMGKSKKSTPVPVDTSDRIAALHLTSITVTIYATHQSKEYKVLPATKITANGQPVALTALHGNGCNRHDRARRRNRRDHRREVGGKKVRD